MFERFRRNPKEDENQKETSPTTPGDIKRERVKSARAGKGEARADLDIFIIKHPEFTGLRNLKGKSLDEALANLKNTDDELKQHFVFLQSERLIRSVDVKYEESRPAPVEHLTSVVIPESQDEKPKAA